MLQDAALAPFAHLRKSEVLPTEPFFLDYATKGSLGWFIVKAASVPDAIDKATGALQGLPCTRAALRRTRDRNAGSGEGTVLALYTPVKGWTSGTESLELTVP